MPSPSYWPLVFAFSLPVIGYGFVFKNWWILAAGVTIALFGLMAWAIEPPTEDDHGHGDAHDDAHGEKVHA